MPFLPNLIASNLRAIKAPEYPIYEKIIQHCYNDPPPFVQKFYGRRYFELARKSEWFANSLVANSALEGYGSTQIWKFSIEFDDDRYSEALRQHALDKSRHSTMFIRMLELTFPGIKYDAATAATLTKLQPRYTKRKHPPTLKRPREELLIGRAALDELIQVHITEIRALILQYLLRPVLLTYAPEMNTATLTSASDVLIRDEGKHIRYTAEFFEEAAGAGEEEFLLEAFSFRVREFNELTLEELEREEIEI